MNIRCACGEVFRDGDASALDRFIAHRADDHGDDYILAGILPPAPVHPPRAKPCIICKTSAGGLTEDGLTHFRSAKGRCRRCYDRTMDAREAKRNLFKL